MKKTLLIFTILISLLAVCFASCNKKGSDSSSSDVQEYVITWVVDDTNTITKVKEGETPEYYGAPLLKEESSFIGWEPKLENATGPATYVAQWAKLYTITFDTNGGSEILAIRQESETQITSPTNPTKIGYTFAGWYSDSSLTTAYTFNKMPAQNLTLYAKWTANSYTIKFNANGGTGSMTNISMRYDTAKNLTANTFVNAGYRFAGWATSASGNVVYADQASVVNLTQTNGASVTLYAKWIETQNVITFNSNGGSIVNAIIQNYNTTISAPTNPTRTGYTFAGWYSDSSLTTAYTFSKMPSQDITLYAKWTANSYTIKFNANSGTGSMSNLSMTYDIAKNLTANAFTKQGYSFIAWNTKADGSGISYEGGQLIKNLTSVKSESITLYAIWTANTYLVVYNPNGGTGVMLNQAMKFDTKQGLATNSFAKAGYTFAGWNTKADGSGTSYSNNQEVSNLTNTLNGVVTLYATWTTNTYTVKFNANGGSGSISDQTFTYDLEQTLTANAFTKTGYSFDGWATTANGGKQYSNKQSVKNLTPTNGGSVTLYAVWKINQYTITFNSNGGSEVLAITNDYNSTVTAPANPTKNGYAFAGWYSDIELLTPYSFSKMPANNVSLYAKWTGNGYRVVYNPNGGSLLDGSVSVTSNNLIPSFSHSTRESNGIQYTVEAGKRIRVNGTATALSTFSVWGTSTALITIPAGTYFMSGAPVQNSVTFCDNSVKYVDKGNGAIFTIETPLTTLFKLRAPSGVTADNLLFVPSIQKISEHVYGNNKALDLNAFVKDGYKFVGWNTKPDGTGVTYADGAIVSNLTTAENGVITLYAMWEESVLFVNNFKNIQFADAQVYHENGTYYIYGTSDRDNNEMDCYTTTDFKTFTRHTGIYVSDTSGWEHDDGGSFYAPELYKINGLYYLYHSAKDKSGVRYLSVLVANSPLGPFRHISGFDGPVFKDLGKSLDAHLFVDGNNTYMYYATIDANTNESIWGVKLKSPYEADLTTKKELLRPGYIDSSFSESENVLTWEKYRSELYGYSSINEAPFMVKNNGKYYLTYSVNGTWEKWYNVCYAVGDSPLGDFTKPYTKGQLWTNLLLGYPGDSDLESELANQWSTFSSGNGHHSFFYVGDQLMISYQTHVNRKPVYNPETNKPKYQKRYLAFDYVNFDKNGVPFVNGPTFSEIPLPDVVTGYTNASPYATVTVSNVTKYQNVNDNYNVDCYNLVQEEGKEVVLGKGTSTITFNLDGNYNVGAIVLYNSAYYEKYIDKIAKIDLGGGNVFNNVSFDKALYVKDANEFIYPNSTITIEFNSTIKTNKITFTFNLSEGGQINDIVILGEKDNTSHTVKFVDENGTVLQSSILSYGEMPVYTGKIPTKASTSQYMYTFGGWDKQISTVKCDVTYKAVFNRFKISESKKINVYLIAGQSNAVGYGLDTDNLIAYSDSRFVNGFDNVLYYGAQERLSGEALNVNFKPLKLGMGVSSTRSGPEIGIASAIADNGAVNAIIKCAWGSSYLYPDFADNVSLTQGTWTSPSYINNNNVDLSKNPNIGKMYYLYEETLIIALNKLIEDGYNPVIQGLWWMQGESEMYSSTMSDAYDELLTLLISDMRTTVTKAVGYDCGKMPFVVGLPSLNKSYTDLPQWEENVRSQIEKVATSGIVNVACVDTVGLQQHDRLNFSAIAQKYLGEQFVLKAKALNLGLPISYVLDGNLQEDIWTKVNSSKVTINANGATVNILGSVVGKGVLFGITVNHSKSPNLSTNGSGNWNTYLNVEFRFNSGRDSFVYTCKGKQNKNGFIGGHKSESNGNKYITTFEIYIPFTELGVSNSTTSIGFSCNGWIDTGWCWFDSANKNWEELYIVNTKGITAGISQYVIKDSLVPLSLHYDEQAPFDNECSPEASMMSGQDVGWQSWSLPIGNGYFGANVFGRTESERIQITEKTLSNPWQYRYNNGTSTTYPAIGGLNNFSETYIDFNHTNSAVTNYNRYLDLNTAISGTSYTYNGVNYTREYFTSYPDKALVIRLDASVSGKLNFVLRPTIPFKQEYMKYENDGFSKTGQVVASVQNGVGHIELTGKLGYYDVDFVGYYKVYTNGGSVLATTCTNSYGEKDGTITVKDATSAYIVVTLGTDYELSEEIFLTGQYDKNKPTSVTTLEDAKRKVGGYLNAILLGINGKSFEDAYTYLKERHLTDYQGLFGRVNVDINSQKSDIELTTDKLLEKCNNGKISSYMETLLLQYGRYLIIASSREGALPANLQGAWNCYNTPAWSSGYWNNVNIQMNYWHVFSTNLAETFESYIDFNQAFLPAAQNNATNLVNKHNPNVAGQDGGNGWTISTASNPYYIGSDRSCGNMGFTTQLYWDYYQFTKDPEVLKVVYEMLVEAAKYVTKCVKEYDGLYLVEYSDSPEMHVNGVWYYTTGTTYAQTLAYLNNYAALECAKALGIDVQDSTILSQEDKTIFRTILQQLDKYDPIHVGLSGQIKEFREETYYGSMGNPIHRHISQLVGLFPGNLINGNTEAWLDAALVSLEGRLDGLEFYDGWQNYDQSEASLVGWSWAHKQALFARAGLGDRAQDMLEGNLKGSTLNNLLMVCGNIFQIEASSGTSAAIAEMLLQSQDGYIAPLAAIPSSWTSGSYKGLVARGNFEVSAAWENSLATSFNILSKNGGKVTVKYPSITQAKVYTINGMPISYTVEGQDLISFNTQKGQTYVIFGFKKVETPNKVTSFEYNRSGLGEYTFTWDKVSGATKYNIYVAVENASKYTLIGTVSGNTFTYTAPSAQANLRTTFAITAVNSSGRESARTLTYFNPIDIEATISNATWSVLSSGKMQVVVEAENATKYYLWELKEGASEYEVIAESSTSTIVADYYNLSSKYAVTVLPYINGKSSEMVEIADRHGIDNILDGKQFVPTTEALNQVYSNTYKYENLTDGINFTSATGRYSSKIGTGIFDATIDLKGGYLLSELRIYDFNADIVNAGKDLIIQTLSGGVWTTVIKCTSNSALSSYRVNGEGNVGWLSFKLNGAKAQKIRIYISGTSASNKAITFYEIECAGVLDNTVSKYEQNIFSGKSFTPSTEGANNIYNSSYGYQTLTDGILYQESSGRFSSKQNGMVDGTISLGGVYMLSELKVHLYKDDLTKAGSSIQIQALYNGTWTTLKEVNNADLSSYVVNNPNGTYDYLSFDLNYALAEQLRIYIPSCTSSGWITFYEIECSGMLVK